MTIKQTLAQFEKLVAKDRAAGNLTAARDRQAQLAIYALRAAVEPAKHRQHEIKYALEHVVKYAAMGKPLRVVK